MKVRCSLHAGSLGVGSRGTGTQGHGDANARAQLSTVLKEPRTAPGLLLGVAWGYTMKVTLDIGLLGVRFFLFTLQSHVLQCKKKGVGAEIATILTC